MKKLFTLLALIVITTINAQAPQGFNYQATVRNSAGALIVNQNVYFKFNIMLNSSTSLPIFSETHLAPTDDLGQINLVVGTGTATTGTFAGINWGSGSYFLGIELNTGTGYVAMGTTKLLSVPYALYANTSGSTTGNSDGFTHYVGELFGGGIVVSVWKNAGIEHGIIASLTDLGTSVWSNVASVQIGTSAQSTIDGYNNTIAITNQQGHTNSAAKICDDYTAGGFNDWYLPAIYELKKCFDNLIEINQVLGETNGFTPIMQNENNYWSSTEAPLGDAPNSSAWYFDYLSNGMNYYNPIFCSVCDYPGAKNHSNRVRAIRKF
jgi:hypothetical protein